MTYVLGMIATVLVTILFLRFPIPTIIGFLTLVFSVGLYFAFTSTHDWNDIAPVGPTLAASDMELEGVTLNQVQSIWHLEGSMTNNSSSTLNQLDLLVGIENCQSGGECEEVGQDVVRIYDDLPPGQSVTFQALVDFRSVPTLDDWRWSITIIEALGK